MAPANTDGILPLDRRGASRYTVYFPVKLVESGGTERLGICRDMSCTGGVLMTQNRLEVGERVEVSLYLSPDHSRATTLGARVVRVEQRPIHNRLWKYDTAMRFEQRLIGLEPEIAQKSKEQRSSGAH